MRGGPLLARAGGHWIKRMRSRQRERHLQPRAPFLEPRTGFSPAANSLFLADGPTPPPPLSFKHPKLLNAYFVSLNLDVMIGITRH